MAPWSAEMGWGGGALTEPESSLERAVPDSRSEIPAGGDGELREWGIQLSALAASGPWEECLVVCHAGPREMVLTGLEGQKF